MRLRWGTLGWAAAVAFVTLIPYAQTVHFDFINFDDYSYVHQSPVAKGLSLDTVKWAMTDAHTMSNWHPVTYLSLMADVSLFGLNAGAIHLHNVLLHALAAALLFVFLYRLLSIMLSQLPDGCERESLQMPALLATLFWSLHPLRAESVAWISSRKDVLSAVFCFAALLAHLSDVALWCRGRSREARWQNLADGDDAWFGSWRWWLGFGLFTVGCMCKPTMMVFPAFVALIEWLASGRVRWKAFSVYAVASICVLQLTVSAQAAGGAMQISVPLVYRVMNAAVSVAAYLRQIVIPCGLSVFYPYDTHLSRWAVAEGFVVVVALLGLAAGSWRRVPVLMSVIFWFLIALIPVLGLIQVGFASRADRYTYLASVGVSLVMATGLAGLMRFVGRPWRWAVISASATVVLALGVADWRQIGYWRDDPSLFKHALSVTADNYLAQRNLGLYYYRRIHDCSVSVSHFEKALRINREANRAAQLFYIFALAESGALEKAKEETRDLSEYGEQRVLDATGKGESGSAGAKPTRIMDTFLAYAMIAHYEKDDELAHQHLDYVLRLCPQHEEAHYIKGLIAYDGLRFQEAVEHWRLCLTTNTGMPRTYLKARIQELNRKNK